MEEATVGRGEGKGRPHPERGKPATRAPRRVSPPQAFRLIFRTAATPPLLLSSGGAVSIHDANALGREPCRPAAAVSSAAEAATSTSTTATTPPPPSPPASPRPTADGGAELIRHTRRAAPARPARAQSRLPESAGATGRPRPRALR